jgi:hypothetical protein
VLSFRCSQQRIYHNGRPSHVDLTLQSRKSFVTSRLRVGKVDTSKAIRTNRHPSGTRRAQVRDKTGMTVGFAARCIHIAHPLPGVNFLYLLAGIASRRWRRHRSGAGLHDQCHRMISSRAQGWQGSSVNLSLLSDSVRPPWLLVFFLFLFSERVIEPVFPFGAALRRLNLTDTFLAAHWAVFCVRPGACNAVNLAHLRWSRLVH